MKRFDYLSNGIALMALLIVLAAWQPANAQNLINDPGFETGSPNGLWFESSTNFGTPLCTIDFCGLGGGTGPHTGDWWAWFGGIAAFEEGEVNQSVVIPPGVATLKFWLEIPALSGNTFDYLEVQIDGNTIFYVDDDTGYYPYAQVVLDVSAYADGSSHNVRFHSEIFGFGISNFFVDDVELTVISAGQTIPLSGWSIAIAFSLIALFTFFRFRNIYSA